ncbi:MAG TPA: DUF1585 domain-containing protein [Polyangiaceae bacterium]|jgi:hypothetical protein
MPSPGLTSRRALLAVVALTAAPLLFAPPAKSAPPAASRTLDDYRHFRIAAIDLAGRMPTREEIAAFERPDFDFDRWVDAQLAGPAYVERMTRIYMDLLRLEPNLNFSSGPAQLFREEIQGPDGKPVWVFYRAGQRRAREATDGDFCLSPDETGLVVRPNGTAVGTPKKVSKKLLDAYTVLVKPWWLYKDYASASPSQRFAASWVGADPDYRPVEGLLFEPDGTTPTTAVRVCREEAQTEATGHITVTGRTRSDPDAKKHPGGRAKPAPVDRPYATKHAGDAVSCDTRTALDFARDCGCGPGLARCVPNDSNRQGNAFYFPNHMPLGPNLPLDGARQQAQRWYPYWWSREAVHDLDDLFAGDRDFREILTGRATFVNGPLAQFYRTVQRGNCCGGAELGLGMAEESEPLFDPKNVPADLEPQDVDRWEKVADRGAHAAGILTLPMFLEKYASARARGAVLYNAFLCKSFVADDRTQLPPSSEPNLTVRPGCSTCHATLEPLAAYFARVEPGNLVFLPPATFPVKNPACKTRGQDGKMPGRCNALYDPQFADEHGALLRSAYASPAHADATPAGAAEDITRMPEFAQCAVQRVTSSFLGRPLTPDDAPLLSALTSDFVKSGYRMRSLVRAVVRSPAYRTSNNLSSVAWREGRAPEAVAQTPDDAIHRGGGAQ